MGAHLDENGVFSNDKYSAWCPPGFVPLKLTGTPLWDYAWYAPGFVPLKLSGTPLWDYASHRNPAMPRTRVPR